MQRDEIRGFSVDLSGREEGQPVGIVGISGNHSASLSILSFNINGDKAYCQTKNEGSSSSFAVYFYVLFESAS